MAKVRVAASTDVREGAVFVSKISRWRLLLTRVDGRVYAVEDKCAHLGWSMARGKVSGSTLQCPWHGSRFDVRSGENIDWVNAFAGVPMPGWTHRLIALGKAPAPLRTLQTIEESGEVFVSDPDLTV